jgi:hypothetical protein
MDSAWTQPRCRNILSSAKATEGDPMSPEPFGISLELLHFPSSIPSYIPLKSSSYSAHMIFGTVQLGVAVTF